jgi:hypothetical protein
MGRVFRRARHVGVGRGDFSLDLRPDSQNRMQAVADKRADLDLQISLLAEHEVTKLVTGASALAERMGVRADLAEGARPVLPQGASGLLRLPIRAGPDQAHTPSVHRCRARGRYSDRRGAGARVTASFVSAARS